uniref:Uncharacterized protein n=1 Tax=Arundo donax TaxID=35708 RepID=A0A0A9UP32_ARUDO
MQESVKQVPELIPILSTKPGTDEATVRNHSEWTQVLYPLLRYQGLRYSSCINAESRKSFHWQ